MSSASAFGQDDAVEVSGSLEVRLDVAHDVAHGVIPLVEGDAKS